MMLKIFANILLLAPALAVAGCEIPVEAIQKASIFAAVRDTEKLPISNIEITAPGLAVVSYGMKPTRKVIVTFRYECIDKFTPEQIVKNPTGFWIGSYVPMNK